MEQDKKLQKILLNGVEIASANFTEAIMKKVHVLSTNTFHYQPLVSNKVKKAFVFTVVVLVVLILLLSLSISYPDFPFLRLIKIPQLSWNTSYKIFDFIFSFWIVFTANYFIQKNNSKLWPY